MVQGCASNERATPGEPDVPIFDTFPPLPDVDEQPPPSADCKKDPLCQEQAAECAGNHSPEECATAGSACQWCASAGQCWISGEFCPSCAGISDRGLCELHKGCTYCDKAPGPGCVENSEAGSCKCWQMETEGACTDGCEWCSQASFCIPDKEQCVPRRITFVAGPIKIGAADNFAIYPPTFKGLAGADAYCNHVAANSDVGALSGRVFKAWLSSLATSVQERFEKYYVPYINVSSEIVSKGWGHMLSGGGLWSVHKTVFGASAPTTDMGCEDTPNTTQRRVWTGTTPYGMSAARNCGDWTFTSSGRAMVGDQNAISTQWTNMCTDTNACGKSGLLYCFEQ